MELVGRRRGRPLSYRFAVVRFSMWLPLVILGSLIAVVVPLMVRAGGLRSEYRSAVRLELARPQGVATPVTEADLEALPPIVAAWLRRSGVVGKPRIHSFRATFRSAIRRGPDQPWMRGTAEQYDFFDPACRLFWMSARRAGIPVHVYHRYAGSGASMRARVAGLLTVADASGETLARSETVTLLNDMFLLAPAALIDAAIEWHNLTSHTVRVRFTNAGHAVSAIVYFDDAGDLVDFESDDRYLIDGETERLERWSTPVTRHRDFDGMRLFAEGEARWIAQDGDEWAYARFELVGIEYNSRR
jgi:hypothetical protein